MMSSLKAIVEHYGDLIKAYYQSIHESLSEKDIRLALGTTGKYGKIIHLHILMQFGDKQLISTLCGTGSPAGKGSYGYYPKVNLYYEEVTCKKCLRQLELMERES